MKLKTQSIIMVLFLCLCIAATPVSAASSGSGSIESSSAAESKGIITRSNHAPTEIGEEKIAGQFEDGTLLYVTLVECESSNSAARSVETETRKYMFATKNIFGNNVNSFSVESTCTWNKNGTKSTISKLKCTYTVYDSDFSCSWDEANKTNTIYDCSLPLNVYSSKHGNAYYIFYATLNPYANPPKLTMGYSKP